MTDHDETAERTTVTIVTPEGRGAVSVLRVRGPRAIEITSQGFRPLHGSPLSQSPLRRLRLGRIGAGMGDEVVAVVLASGPPEVEIQCHGGPGAVALVADALQALGAERVSVGDQTEGDSRSPIVQAADIELAGAPTLRTAEILLEQADGALDRELQTILDRLDRAPNEAAEALETLLERLALGTRLVSGWSVVLAGRPNVGKSRLLNALAGFERAIVAPTPGTTRDALGVRTAVDGWPVELFDTAGLRPSDELIEAQGIARARALQGKADLVVLVLDRSEGQTTSDRHLMDAMPQALWVANKVDLPAAWLAAPDRYLNVSAKEGSGVAQLAHEIARRLVPSPPAPGLGVPFREEHRRILRDSRDALLRGQFARARATLEELTSAAGSPDRNRR